MYKRIYLQNRNRVTDVENKLIVTRQKMKGMGTRMDVGKPPREDGTRVVVVKVGQIQRVHN